MNNNTYKAIIILLVMGLITLLISTVVFYDKTMTNEALFQHTQEELTMTSEKLKSASSKSETLEIELEHANKLLDDVNAELANFKNAEYEFKYLGDFMLTHYCTETFKHICGTGDGITATGTPIVAGHTIAVDPNVIPYGSQVYIEGYGFRTADDCGGAVRGNHIDIAVETHTKALDIGLKHGGVWVLVEKAS